MGSQTNKVTRNTGKICLNLLKSFKSNFHICTGTPARAVLPKEKNKSIITSDVSLFVYGTGDWMKIKLKRSFLASSHNHSAAQVIPEAPHLLPSQQLQ